ncbi:MAG: HEAT repeat domain-containing protein [Myxococcaceae bacterium]|nr:HEAT repeat domain-containing protein [Myxococcaceae bacterium]
MRSALLVLVLSVPALAQDASPALRRLLTAIDAPPTRAMLVEAGGRDTAMALRALASNGQQPPGLRRAALSALGHFDEAATRGTLAQVTRDTNPVLRKAAVATLGFLTGAATDTALLQALADEAPLVRRAAIVAVSRSAERPARDALERRWAVEPDAETRALLAQALGR